MNNETISTVMAVYNGAKYVAEAIESVLAQTYPSTEIIVVDDGSTDESLAILSKYPQLKIISRVNKGQWHSLNEAISIANGKYVNFIDADDLWHPQKNELQLSHLKQNGAIDMSFCQLEQFTENSQQERIYSKAQSGRIQLACFLEREKFMRVGLFGTSLKGESMLWFQRAMLCGLKEGYLEKVLAYRRSHQENMTRQPQYNQELTNLARKLILQRQHHASGDVIDKLS